MPHCTSIAMACDDHTVQAQRLRCVCGGVPDGECGMRGALRRYMSPSHGEGDVVGGKEGPRAPPSRSTAPAEARCRRRGIVRGCSPAAGRCARSQGSPCDRRGGGGWLLTSRGNVLLLPTAVLINTVNAPAGCFFRKHDVVITSLDAQRELLETTEI